MTGKEMATLFVMLVLAGIAIRTVKCLIIAEVERVVSELHGYDMMPVTPEQRVKLKKTADEIAQDIAAGRGMWGDEPDRSYRLWQAGYDPKEVQEKINAIMKEWRDKGVERAKMMDAEAKKKREVATKDKTK